MSAVATAAGVSVVLWPWLCPAVVSWFEPMLGKVIVAPEYTPDAAPGSFAELAALSMVTSRDGTASFVYLGLRKGLR